MKLSRITHTSQAGFTLLEIIVAIVISAIVGVVTISYMGTSLIRSSDPIVIARDEGIAETWLEFIESDFVKEMNDPVNYPTALATIYGRCTNYHNNPYNMPASVTLTRTYITYDANGNEVVVTGGGTSTNLKVTVQAGGYPLTAVLTAVRVTAGDSIAYY
jgi:prepilin-type N-terminal cleavage/methylation domain-containing protein